MNIRVGGRNRDAFTLAAVAVRIRFGHFRHGLPRTDVAPVECAPHHGDGAGVVPHDGTRVLPSRNAEMPPRLLAPTTTISSASTSSSRTDDAGPADSSVVAWRSGCSVVTRFAIGEAFASADSATSTIAWPEGHPGVSIPIGGMS